LIESIKYKKGKWDTTVLNILRAGQITRKEILEKGKEVRIPYRARENQPSGVTYLTSMRTKQNNFFKRTERLFTQAREVSKEKGVYYVILMGIKIIINYVRASFGCWYYKLFKSMRTFTFKKESYNYFYHKYNSTWRNERCVEIPIIWKIVKKYEGKRILEIGNVLTHYFPVNHDILDKYEKGEGVINQDVVDFQTTKKYDLIVSISTLEHVGWDESPCEPMKILQAIENLKKSLLQKGKLVVTLPLGYNPIMDELLKKGKIQFTEMYCLKRISRDNKWIETDWEDIKDIKYGYPFSNANGLVVINVIERAFGSV